MNEGNFVSHGVVEGKMCYKCTDTLEKKKSLIVS